MKVTKSSKNLIRSEFSLNSEIRPKNCNIPPWPVTSRSKRQKRHKRRLVNLQLHILFNLFAFPSHFQHSFCCSFCLFCNCSLPCYILLQFCAQRLHTNLLQLCCKWSLNHEQGGGPQKFIYFIYWHSFDSPPASHSCNSLVILRSFFLRGIIFCAALTFR